MFWW